MKNITITIAILLTTFSLPIYAADVGVSVTIGQPGFFGRIDIGDYPYTQPRLIYRQPRMIERSSNRQSPIYFHVPTRHSQNWAKYCHEYSACGLNVYFVQDSWYQNEYSPRYREHNKARQGGRGHEGRGKMRDESRGDIHDGGRRSENGSGKGHRD